MKKGLKIVGLFTVLCLSILEVRAQSRIIQGRVIDAQTGSGVPSVSVRVSGGASALSDKDGNFSIVASGAVRLLLDNKDYESVEEEVAAGSNEVSVAMTPVSAQALDEVVVVGYATVKKSNLTGSVGVLDKRVLKTGARSNPASALAGTVAGLRVQQITGRPGGLPNIILRGGTGYTGGGSPLVLVDGLIRSGFNDINQEDIESMDVLKDASATAIYGARAANGVILITTKRGKEGVSNIQVRSRIGFNTINLPFQFLGAEDYIKWSRGAVRTSGLYDPSRLSGLNTAQPYGTGNRYRDAEGNLIDGNVTNTGVWSTMRADDLSFEDQKSLLGQGWRLMKDADGTDLIYKDFSYREQAVRPFSLTQDYNISMTGGNAKGKYYASVGSYDEQGLPINTFYNRITFILNGDYKIKPWLTAMSGLNFSNKRARGVHYGAMKEADAEKSYLARALGAPPTMRGTNPNGDLLLGRDWMDGNPRVNADKFIRRNLNQKITMSQAFLITFIPSLTLKVSGNWFLDQSHNEHFNRDYLNSPGEWVRTRSSSATYDKIFRQTYNSVLQYREKFFNYHHLDALLGWEFYDMYSSGFSASGQGAPTDDFMALGLTSPDANLRNIKSYHERQRINSYFSRVMYNYDQKYLFSFTARADGYSRLLDNRWGFFPGVSVGWNMHRENFMRPYIGLGKVVNTLKLRASYGQSGTVPPPDQGGIGAYTLLGSYGATKYNAAVGYNLSTLRITNLKWETLVTYEVGLEMRLFNRVDLSADYYIRRTSNKIGSLRLPASGGFTSITNNSGSMQNQGVEITLNYQIARTRDWDVSVYWNTAYNANKILKLPENGLEKNRQGEGVMQVWDPNNPKELIWVKGLQEGQDPNIAYAYQALGIIRTQADLDRYTNYDPNGYANKVFFKDRMGQRTLVHPKVFEKMDAKDKTLYYPLALGDVMWRDVNGDGEINQYDQVYQGRTVPRFTGGFGGYFRWKDFTLSTRFDYALGFVAYDGARSWFLANAQGSFNTTKNVFDTWSPENPGAKYPTYYWADQLFKGNITRGSSMFYNKGDYLSLREISIGYILPKSIARRLRMQEMNLTLTGQNLYYWTKNTLYSAESGSTVFGGGGGYPLPRIFIIQLSLTF